MRHLFFAILAFILITPQLPSTAQSDDLTARETMRIGRGTIRHVEWHPDGDLILVDTANGAWLYDDNLKDVAHLLDIRLARFSSDGQYISGVNAANELLIYDVRTRYLLHRFAEHDHHIRELHWQGNRLATYDGYQLVLWEDLQVMAEISQEGLQTLSWNPSGTMLVAAKNGRSLLVVTNDGDFWEFPAPFGILPMSIRFFWQDDSTLVRTFLTEYSRVATFIDVQNGSEPHEAFDGSYNLYSVYQRYLAITDQEQFRLVDLTSDTFDVYEQVPGVPHRVEWSNDGQLMAYSVSFSREVHAGGPLIYIVDLGGNTKSVFQGTGTLLINHLAWQPGDKKLMTLDLEHRLDIWDIETGRLESSSTEHSLFKNLYSLSSTGEMIALADKGTGFSVWDKNGMLFYKKSPLSTPIEFIDWQPGGDWLVTSAKTTGWDGQIDDPTIIIWDGASGNTIDMINIGSVPYDIAWRPDGRVLGIASVPDVAFWDGNLTIYSPEDLGLPSSGRHRTISWSPDSSYVSIQGFPAITVIESLWLYQNLSTPIANVDIRGGHRITNASMTWDNGVWRQVMWIGSGWSLFQNYQSTGPHIKDVYPHETEYLDLDSPTEPLDESLNYGYMRWSPDASLILASRKDVLRVWDVSSGAYLYWTEGINPDFSPDSQYLAILNGTRINILHAMTGDVLLTVDVEREFDWQYDLQWSDDGTHLAIGGEGVVSVWEIKPE